MHEKCYENWTEKITFERFVEKCWNEFVHSSCYEEMEKKFGKFCSGGKIRRT